VSDPADDAQAIEELERAASIRRATSPDTRPRRFAEGFCEGCADEIDPERLAANPAARRCITCQETRERNSRLFGARS
jgi:RNA polymerase-binding transcription factor DksA